MRKTIETLINRALKREAKYREMAEEVRMARQEAAAMHLRSGLFNRKAQLSKQIADPLGSCDRYGHPADTADRSLEDLSEYGPKEVAEILHNDAVKPRTKRYNKPPERPAMSDAVEVAAMLVIGLVSLFGLLIMADMGWLHL